MIQSKHLTQVARLRQLRLDRSAIALARSNQLAAEQTLTATAAEAMRAQLEADLVPGLKRHLDTTAALGGASERFACFVIAATADRRALASQAARAQLAQREAEAALRRAEDRRKEHAQLTRRVGGLDGMIEQLQQSDRRKAAPLEEDRVLEQHQARRGRGDKR